MAVQKRDSDKWNDNDRMDRVQKVSQKERGEQWRRNDIKTCREIM
jgi:hypothetical protein